MERRPTLTLTDVALLARVSRPVVSMWRRRPRVRGQQVPFPSAIATVGGVKRFDRDEIVTWLEQTGRGNNPEARQDAPALSIPDSADAQHVVMLLCLHAMSGTELANLDTAELHALAEQIDPADEILQREVHQLRADPDLFSYVDDLVGASYGVSDALARFESGRLQRQAAERGLSEGVVELLCTVCDAAQAHLGGESVALVPPSDHRLASRLADGFPGILAGPAVSGRDLRRRAVIEGFEVITEARGTVRVVSVVGESETVALDALDELVVSLGPTDIGIALGSAAVLCDELTGNAEQRRSQTLRAGNLAMAIRLPRGLWKAAHQQSLAVWIVQGGRHNQSLRMADLTSENIDLTDLASDISAALMLAEARAYRYARGGELAPVLAGGPVVPRGVRAVRLGTAGSTSHLDQIHTATLTTSEPVLGYDVTAAPAPGQILLKQRSLGELVAAGQLAMKRGTRIEIGGRDLDGTVRVLTADANVEDARLDPFDAVRLYPRATRTEPGDVIFLQRPRPLARVDLEGGALVASPSRILRLQPGASIGPQVLAAIINLLARPGTDWQTWSAPDLHASEAEALDTALSGAAQYLANLQRHVQATHDLTTSLIRGVASGAVSIDPINTKRAG
ncbi:helix-turn-helix transcriptional regulator [Kribbella sp. NPDC049227]|uniref:helix-turn-helix transcriptional regulator n=1 Tax=Kribbella sp. NPDC049227 TaxID=3364113 RepID=UPI00370FBBA0